MGKSLIPFALPRYHTRLTDMLHQAIEQVFIRIRRSFPDRTLFLRIFLYIKELDRLPRSIEMRNMPDLHIGNYLPFVPNAPFDLRYLVPHPAKEARY